MKDRAPGFYGTDTSIIEIERTNNELTESIDFQFKVKLWASNVHQRRTCNNIKYMYLCLNNYRVIDLGQSLFSFFRAGFGILVQLMRVGHRTIKRKHWERYVSAPKTPLEREEFALFSH